MAKSFKLVFIFLLVFLSSHSVFAQNETSNRINGVAEFLLDRANDNFIYILQQQMKANDLFKCYLPETYKYATSSNLKLLLQSGSELWKDVVETDLKDFGVQLIFKNMDPLKLKAWSLRIVDQYNTAMTHVFVQIDGVEFPIDRIPLSANQEVKDTINSFYEDYLKAIENIKVIISNVRAVNQPDSAGCPSVTYVSVGAIIQNAREALENLKKQMARFEKADVVWKSGVALNLEPGSEFLKSVMSVLVVGERLEYYKQQIELIMQEDSLLQQMFQLDLLIRESIQRGDNPLIFSSGAKVYDQFSNYALSLAALSEAESKDQVKSVLQQLTLPPVSFALKRKAGVSKLLLTAYFGAQGGYESNADDSENGFYGLFVPLGIEYSYGLSRGTLSLMLSPFDFANPVNQIINDDTGEADFEDIFCPGIYASYGFESYPLVIGAGYSRGKSITESRDDNEGRYLIFVAFDMPLFNLY